AEFPAEVDCASLIARVEREGIAPEWGLWTSVVPLASGEVHLSAVPLTDSRGAHGYVVLAQDLGFIERRSASTSSFLLGSFAVLAVAASVLTIVASRVSWRGWSEELRGFLRGNRERAEFRPIMADVRELVDRLLDQEGRAWTPLRLRETLHHQFGG